jgi:hypothetical protein
VALLARGRRTGPIHYVVQPVTRAQMDELESYGPHLTVAMFDRDEQPPLDGVEAFAAEARAVFAMRARASTP